MKLFDLMESFDLLIENNIPIFMELVNDYYFIIIDNSHEILMYINKNRLEVFIANLVRTLPEDLVNFNDTLLFLFELCPDSYRFIKFTERNKFTIFTLPNWEAIL